MSRETLGMKSKKRKPPDTRNLLLVSARATFHEKGYPATRVSDICAGAGVSHGTFYTYFKNKEDIFEALLKEMLDDISAYARRVWTRDDIRLGIEETIRGFLEVYAQHRDLMASARHLTAVDTRFMEIYRKGREQLFAKIMREIEYSSAQGLCRKTDPYLASRILGSMLEQFAYTLLVENPELDREKGLSVLTELWFGALGYKKQE